MPQNNAIVVMFVPIDRSAAVYIPITGSGRQDLFFVQRPEDTGTKPVPTLPDLHNGSLGPDDSPFASINDNGLLAWIERMRSAFQWDPAARMVTAIRQDGRQQTAKVATSNARPIGEWWGLVDEYCRWNRGDIGGMDYAAFFDSLIAFTEEQRLDLLMFIRMVKYLASIYAEREIDVTMPGTASNQCVATHLGPHGFYQVRTGIRPIVSVYGAGVLRSGASRLSRIGVIPNEGNGIITITAQPKRGNRDAGAPFIKVIPIFKQPEITHRDLAGIIEGQTGKPIAEMRGGGVEILNNRLQTAYFDITSQNVNLPPGASLEITASYQEQGPGSWVAGGQDRNNWLPFAARQPLVSIACELLNALLVLKLYPELSGTNRALVDQIAKQAPYWLINDPPLTEDTLLKMAGTQAGQRAGGWLFVPYLLDGATPLMEVPEVIERRGLVYLGGEVMASSVISGISAEMGKAFSRAMICLGWNLWDVFQHSEGYMREKLARIYSSLVPGLADNLRQYDSPIAPTGPVPIGIENVLLNMLNAMVESILQWQIEMMLAMEVAYQQLMAQLQALIDELLALAAALQELLRTINSIEKPDAIRAVSEYEARAQTAGRGITGPLRPERMAELAKAAMWIGATSPDQLIPNRQVSNPNLAITDSIALIGNRSIHLTADEEDTFNIEVSMARVGAYTAMLRVETTAPDTEIEIEKRQPLSGDYYAQPSVTMAPAAGISSYRIKIIKRKIFCGQYDVPLIFTLMSEQGEVWSQATYTAVVVRICPTAKLYKHPLFWKDRDYPECDPYLADAWLAWEDACLYSRGIPLSISTGDAEQVCAIEETAEGCPSEILMLNITLGDLPPELAQGLLGVDLAGLEVFSETEGDAVISGLDDRPHGTFSSTCGSNPFRKAGDKAVAFHVYIRLAATTAEGDCKIGIRYSGTDEALLAVVEALGEGWQLQ